MRRLLLGVPAAALLASFSPPCAAPLAAQESIPLYTDFGSLHREVSTRSAEAQAFFDQGLMLAYAFQAVKDTSSSRSRKWIVAERPGSAWASYSVVFRLRAFR